MKKFICLLLILFSIGLVAPLTVSADAPWWDTSWAFRTQITLDNSSLTGAVTDIPVYIELDSTNFDFTHAQTNGEDVRFVDSDDSTSLEYWFETYDSTGEYALAWVKVPQLDNNDTDYIWVYYGNSSATDHQDKNAVYDASCMMVQTFDEGFDGDPAIVYDETSNSNDGTVTGAVTADGKVGKGLDFDGTDDNVDCGSTSWSSNELTVMVQFFPPTGVTPGPDFIVYKQSGPYYWAAEHHASGRFLWILEGANSTTTYKYVNGSITINAWNSLAVTQNGTSVILYVNGAVIGTETFTTTPSEHSAAGSIFLGENDSSTYDLDGIEDNATIYNSALSADEIKVQHIQTIDGYRTFGSEEVGTPFAPTNLELTKDSNSQVVLTWTKGDFSDNTQIRRAIGNYPTSLTDGTLVYSGPDSTFTDTGSDVGLGLDNNTYYYSAWSGISTTWSTDYISNRIGGTTMLLIGLIVLACFLTYFSSWRRFLPASMAASVAWFGIGILWIVSPATIGIDTSSQWTQYLSIVFVLLTFVPVLLYMRPLTTMHSETTRRTRDGSVSFRTEGRYKPRKTTSTERSNSYRDNLRNLRKR